MKKGSGGGGRKGKGPSRSDQTKAKKAKSKRKPKKPSRRGSVKAARERLAGLVDPNIHVVVADELRIQILAVAIQRPYAPSDFARDVNISVNSAAYHFKKLEEHGYLELVNEEQVRGSTKHYYRATKSGYISEANWGEVADALRPGVAGAILQDFNGRTSQAIETETLFSRDSAALYWAPEDLDEIAWEEQTRIVNFAIEATKQLVVDTANRRASGESEGSFHATFAIASYPSPTHEEVKKHEAKEGRRKRKSGGKSKAKGSTAKGKGAGKAKGSRSGGAAKGKGTAKRKRGKA